jgi:hypothetical protein
MAINNRLKEVLGVVFRGLPAEGESGLVGGQVFDGFAHLDRVIALIYVINILLDNSHFYTINS